MKKIFLTIIIIFNLILPIQASQNMMLKAGISLTSQVPNELYGLWEVKSIMTYTNNPEMFNKISVDYWNISKSNDVITLSNPFSGAITSVTVEDVHDNEMKFKYITKNKKATMTEMPTIILNGEKFHGTDKIILEKYENDKKISEDIVIYKISATKIKKENINDILKYK